MSIQAASQFIQAVRQDENLKNQIRILGYPVSGEELVQIGRGAGFDYTEAELQTAFKQDWVMRSLRYGFMETEVKL
ncbi:Nif11-like leader peptide family natural product precursor [Nostoc sp.]|uniref:Nif11-like leader peptide family natural product precursor n=1 Tax=Nostoc sp. TaxID=1180 RepID=UPI002FF6A007